MSVIQDFREALKDYLVTATQTNGSAGFPATLAMGTFYIRPYRGRDYVQHKAGEITRFGRPEVSLQIILVAPGSAAKGAQDWLDAKIDAFTAAIKANPTLNGKCTSMQIEGFSEPGLINQSTIGVELSLAPFHIVGMTS